MQRRTNKMMGLGVNKSTLSGRGLIRKFVEDITTGQSMIYMNRTKSLSHSAIIAAGSVFALTAGSSLAYSQVRLPVPPPGQSPTMRSVGLAPGLESFAVQPQTPVELIEAIDYLIRVQREDQALTLAQKLLDPVPDEEALLEVRNRFGSGKLLALQNTRDPRLKQLLLQFADHVIVAAKAETKDTDRIARLIELLSASKEEAEIARERLARVGTHCVGPLIDAYVAADEGLKPKIAAAFNELQSSALPALFAATQHPDAGVQAVVATSLGSIADPSALPWLAWLSTKPGATGAAARQSWSRITGDRPIGNPVAVLTTEAARYLDRDVYFTADKVEIWTLDSQKSTLKPITVERSVAEGAIGYRLCRLALELDPKNPDAQSIALSTLLQEESDRLGMDFPAKDPSGIWAIAKATGPETLSLVLKRALQTGKHERVAVLAIQALSEVIKAEDLAVNGPRPHVLVDALNAPSRRIQFEAAQTLVRLKPYGGFPGSSRVIPILARFVQYSPQIPRAVIISNNLVEGGDWMAYLRHAGYDPILEMSGRDGFTEAARRGDAELVLTSTMLDPYGWALPETVSNFKADARTSGIPLIIAGPLSSKARLNTLLNSHPGVGFIVSPANQQIADRQIAFQLSQMGVLPLSATERVDYSDRAKKLLAELAPHQPKGGIASMVNSLEPQILRPLLIQSLDDVETVAPVVDRAALTGQVLQDSLDPAARTKAAIALRADLQTNNIQLPAATIKQFQTLFLSLEKDGNPQLRDAVAGLVGVENPVPDVVSQILIKFAPKAEIYEVAP